MTTVEANALVQQSPEYAAFVAARRALESITEDTPTEHREDIGEHYHQAYDGLRLTCRKMGASGYALIQRGVHEATS